MNTINNITPKLRDNSLIKNIGKYELYSEKIIPPIGVVQDIYEKTDNLKSIFLNDGNLLNYTNNPDNIKEIPRQSRGIIPIEIYPDYIPQQKYTWVEGEGYHEQSPLNWMTIGPESVYDYFMGGNMGLNVSGKGVGVESTTVDRATNIANRVLEIPTEDSNLSKIGLKSLGLAFYNTNLENLKRIDEVESLLDKKLSKLNSFIDNLEQMNIDNLNLPPVLAKTLNIGKNFIPMYFYSDVQKTSTNSGYIEREGISEPNEFGWLNFNKNGTGISTVNGGNFTDIGANELIKESNKIGEPAEKMSIDLLGITKQSLLYKTQKMFETRKIETMISQMGKSSDSLDKDISPDNIMSKGRNLRKKGAGKSALNEDFCRVWTSTSKYNKIRNLIRPFDEEKKETLDNSLKHLRPNGGEYLKKYGILQDDGFVKIAPYGKDFEKEDPKKYMFSIENLAWKDSIDSLIEGTSQEGPNGGRIMWFPPYDISFNETTSVNINSDAFIGRGEPVYTYVNTERTGTISFKVIVDHPSIINSYTGKETDKAKDVDGNDINEDDILRFFAGCDVLDTSVSEPQITTTGDTTDKTKTGDDEKEIPEENVPRTLKFKVYFPNNYSGVGDGFKDTLKYLYEGALCSFEGGNGYENVTGDWMGLTPSGSTEPCVYDKYYHRVDSNQILSPETNYKDLRSFGLNNSKGDGITDPDTYSFREVYSSVEINKYNPTSNDGLKAQAKNNYIDAEIDYRRADFDKKITDTILFKVKNDLENIQTQYLEKKAEYDAAVEPEKSNLLVELQILETEMNNAKGEYDTAKTNADNNDAIYFPLYETFLATQNENKKLNGGDINSINFSSILKPNNTNIFYTVDKNENINLTTASEEYKNKLNITNLALNNYLTAIETDNDIATKKSNYEDTLINLSLAENELLYQANEYLNSVSGTISENDILKTIQDATAITIIGSASKQGTTSGNITLTKNRANILRSWLTQYTKNFSKDDERIIIESAYDESPAPSDRDISSKSDKKDRFAYVVIKTGGEKIDTEAEAKGVGYTTGKPISPNPVTVTATATATVPVEKTKRYKKSMYGFYYDPNNPNDNTIKRNNDEASFFKKIGKENTFIFDKLREKLKYFHPAFHSTTPEGFNSRLTFLQQCTRQGPTMSSTDMNNPNRTSTNMSFGRPPICVLRIGDFYNTKVIFDSLNIAHEPLVWDLNDEGIGVQPMLANINMNFKFIGGSDLTGPITRLQNAITFNFFANTSVYDDRTDTNKIDEKTNSIRPLYNPYVYDDKK